MSKSESADDEQEVEKSKGKKVHYSRDRNSDDEETDDQGPSNEGTDNDDDESEGTDNDDDESDDF